MGFDYDDAVHILGLGDFDRTTDDAGTFDDWGPDTPEEGHQFEVTIHFDSPDVHMARMAATLMAMKARQLALDAVVEFRDLYS